MAEIPLTLTQVPQLFAEDFFLFRKQGLKRLIWAVGGVVLGYGIGIVSENAM